MMAVLFHHARCVNSRLTAGNHLQNCGRMWSWKAVSSRSDNGTPILAIPMERFAFTFCTRLTFFCQVVKVALRMYSAVINLSIYPWPVGWVHRGPWQTFIGNLAADAIKQEQEPNDPPGKQSAAFTDKIGLFMIIISLHCLHLHAELQGKKR